MEGAKGISVEQQLLPLRAEEEALKQPRRVRVWRALEDAAGHDDERGRRRERGRGLEDVPPRPLLIAHRGPRKIIPTDRLVER